jgi:hypothetical protein
MAWSVNQMVDLDETMTFMAIGKAINLRGRTGVLRGFRQGLNGTFNDQVASKKRPPKATHLGMTFWGMTFGRPAIEGGLRRCAS